MGETRLSRAEFVALAAMLFATIAFSIDAMLPALPEIAGELTPANPNAAQLVLTSFVLGMGIGTLFTGPLSDAFGRKPVIYAGTVLYIGAAALAYVAPSLEMLLLARVLQGLGAAAARVVIVAVIRDIYEGRQMAQIMSFVIMVFTLVPAVAPAIGVGVIWAIGWRGIFLAFILFACISVTWMWARLPETLPPERRRPFRPRPLMAGIVEILTIREVVLSIAVQSLVFGMLFTMLTSTQPVFDQTFGRGASFPFWFALIALCGAAGAMVNSRIVMRLGMRRVAAGAIALQIGLTCLVLALLFGPTPPAEVMFPVHVLWTASVFAMVSLTAGNLNALAMVPLGHLAGLGASVIGAVSTVMAVAIAVPIGLAFDGTPKPLAVGIFVCAVAAWLLMQGLKDPRAEAAGP